MAHDKTFIYRADKSSEWYTPPRYIEAARLVMGSIDLDPASSYEANLIVQAKRYYTKEDNGLGLPWFGRVWLNPPLVDRLIMAWAIPGYSFVNS